MRKALILAMGYLEADRIAAAADAAREALADEPDSADAHYILGSALDRLDDAAGARRHLLRAAELAPGDAAIRHGLGLVLYRGGEAADALPHLEYAAAHGGNPDFAETLGACLTTLGRLAEAEAPLRAVAAARPGDASAWANLGSVLVERHCCEEALEACARALSADPDHVEAHMTRAIALLLAGRWDEAWPEYEWRWRREIFRTAYAVPACPRWRGEALPPGSRLWVRGEQGLGDHIQFARYLPVAAARAAVPVVVSAPPAMHRLLAAVEGVAACAGAAMPSGCAAEIPMASLPGLFGATPQDLKAAAIPYLRAPDAPRLPVSPGRRMRIGVVWADKPKPRSRAVPCDALAAALSGLDAEVFSLQLGEGRAAAAVGWTDLTPLIGDFADTVALVAQMDALISVDTAALHVAGGLGVPVFILLIAGADWRWMRGRSDTPWYPSARLLRQTRQGDWSVPLAELRAALLQLM